MEDITLLSDIIAIWGWHLLGWVAFLNSFIFLVLNKYQYFGGFVGVFLICEIVALRRKWRLQDEN